MKTREELIQDYLEQVLNKEEQAQFDSLLENDPSFRTELQVQTELHTILKHRLNQDVTGLRHQLKLAEESLRASEEETSTVNVQNEASRNSGLRRWIPILAAACILLFGVLFFFPNQDSLYSLPDMRSEIVRGDLSTDGQAYEDAVKAFNRQDYSKSTVILSELEREHPQVLQYTFYLGLSLIGEKKFDAAAEHLTPLANGKSVFRDESQYYLAIALHENGQTEEAKNWLNRITTDAVIYNDAQKLLKALK